MASVNDMLLDAAINHQVDLSQYGNSVVRKMLAILNQADQDMFDKLVSALSRMDADSYTVRRLDALLSSILDLNAAAYKQLGKELNEEMAMFAAVEAEYHQSLFQSALPIELTVGTVTAAQVYAAATSEPFQGRLLKEWYTDLAQARARRIRDQINIGYVSNETTAQIVQRIRGTKAANYADGVLEIDRRHAEAIVRTAISHIANTARDEFYDRNNDLIKAKVWVATLDMRTTSQCQIRDGRKYDLNNQPIGHKVPWMAGPGRLHWNCRSTSTIILKSLKELGIKGVDDVKGTRASMDGQVPEELTYLKWLSKQSAARQDEILGPSRGAVLRQGKLAMSHFWDNKGNYLTLDELRARHAAAFRKAGV